MATRVKRPAIAGHKCLGISVMVHVNCECGWSGGNVKSRKDAYHEWRQHAQTHAAPPEKG